MSISRASSQTSRGEFKPSTVEISVDTSSFVDIKQQDSGSNQSGSDSGLGYTNSISSDNSSYNNNNAASQDHKANNNLACSKQQQQAGQLLSQAASKSDLGSIDETRTNPEETTLSKQTLSKSPKDTTHNDVFCDDSRNSEKHADASIGPVQLAPGAPVIKSVLKKSSPHVTDTPKSNRSVSFNQTVIVFCEEIEAPSLGDQFELPVGYQDSINSFEPPEDYCDHKAERKEAESSTGNGDDGGLKRALTDGANLSDEQLFGLLENESLIDTLKLNCEDFSEDEFPINYLNSSHSYLCNDAISDYDSDSESSLCAQRKNKPAPLQPVTNSVVSVRSETIPNEQSKNQERTKTPTSESAGDRIVSDVQKGSRCEQSDVPKTNAQKSLPARMKVSTVDNTHLKRHQPARKENHDLKSSKPSERGRDSPESDQPISHKPFQNENTRHAPVLIKQTTVEPIALSKSMIVANNLATGVDIAKDTANKMRVAVAATDAIRVLPPKPADQIKSDLNQTRETFSLSHKSLPINQPINQSVNQLQSAQSQQPTCHICRVIESNRSQTNPEVKNVTIRESSTSGNSQQQQVNDAPNQFQIVRTQGNQPVVFNQSCISCREASLKQNIVQNGLQARPAGIAQPMRPLPYQLVYVVDQKGNRIRALSVVRPSFRNPNAGHEQQTTGPPQRILIGPNGDVRFPNPVSIGGQVVNALNGHFVQPQWVHNSSTGIKAQQQVMVLGPSQSSQQLYALPDRFQGQNNLVRAQVRPALQRGPIEGTGLRQHTVYYVRQPLATQNVRTSFDSLGSSSKSFPDPHEIRRLDGLRGPTSSLSLAPKIENRCAFKSSDQVDAVDQFQLSADMVKRNVVPNRDEPDDPTFGFSKRPSVKVVATCSNAAPSRAPSNQKLEPVQTNQERYLTANNLTNAHVTDHQTSGLRPVSVVLMGSQTLDRRNANQQFHAMKENIPGTSSMSNIHGTFISLPNNVSEGTSQQQRISVDQMIDLTTENLKSKDFKFNDQENIRANSNKGVISSNRVESHQAQGRQISSLRGGTVLPEKYRRAQEQSEVAYSMNI